MEEEMETQLTTKDLYYSGFCFSDFYNFAEFYVDKKPELPETISLKSFEFTKKNLYYVLGNKISNVSIKNEKIFFDNLKDRSIGKIFYDYFKTKYPKGEYFWIINFNKKDNDYGIVGIILDNELKGILKLETTKQKEKDK